MKYVVMQMERDMADVRERTAAALAECERLQAEIDALNAKSEALEVDHGR